MKGLNSLLSENGEITTTNPNMYDPYNIHGNLTPLSTAKSSDYNHQNIGTPDTEISEEGIPNYQDPNSCKNAIYQFVIQFI